LAELELAILQLIKRPLTELASKLRHDLLYKDWTDKGILNTRDSLSMARVPETARGKIFLERGIHCCPTFF